MQVVMAVTQATSSIIMANTLILQHHAQPSVCKSFPHIHFGTTTPGYTDEIRRTMNLIRFRYEERDCHVSDYVCRHPRTISRVRMHHVSAFCRHNLGVTGYDLGARYAAPWHFPLDPVAWHAPRTVAWSVRGGRGARGGARPAMARARLRLMRGCGVLCLWSYQLQQSAVRQDYGSQQSRDARVRSASGPTGQGKRLTYRSYLLLVQ